MTAPSDEEPVILRPEFARNIVTVAGSLWLVLAGCGFLCLAAYLCMLFAPWLIVIFSSAVEKFQ